MASYNMERAALWQEIRILQQELAATSDPDYQRVLYVALLDCYHTLHQLIYTQIKRYQSLSYYQRFQPHLHTPKN